MTRRARQTPPGSMLRLTNEGSRSTPINHPKWDQRQAMDGGVAVGRIGTTGDLPCVRGSRTTSGVRSRDPGTWAARSATAWSAGSRRATGAGDFAGAAILVPVRREHDGGAAGNPNAPAVHGVGDRMGVGALWGRATLGECGQGADQPVDNPGKKGGRGMGDVATVGDGGPSGPTLSDRACLTAGFPRAASGRARGNDTGGVRATDGAGRRNHRARVRGSGAGLVMAIVGCEIPR